MQAEFSGGPLDGTSVEIGPSALKTIDVHESTSGDHLMWKKPLDYTGNSWKYSRVETIEKETRETVNPDTLEVEFYDVEIGRSYRYVGTEYAKRQNLVKAKSWNAVGPVRIWNGGDIDVPYIATETSATLANGWKIVW